MSSDEAQERLSLLLEVDSDLTGPMLDFDIEFEAEIATTARNEVKDGESLTFKPGVRVFVYVPGEGAGPRHGERLLPIPAHAPVALVFLHQPVSCEC